MLFVPMTSVFADDVTETQQNLAAANQKLTELNNQIENLEAQQAMIQQQLPQMEQQYTETLSKVSQRSRAMYMTSSTDYLQYLFSSDNLVDLISNISNIATISASDQQLLTEAKEAKEQVELNQQVLSETMAQVQKEKEEVQKLQEKYNNQLQVETGTTTTSIQEIAASDSPKLQKAVQIMINLCNDDTHGYSQANRWGPDYDCSSSIIYSLRTAGFDTGAANAANATFTSALTQRGWVKVATPSSYTSLVAGDILMREGSHVAMYVGNGQIAEFSGIDNGKGSPSTGDQTGREALVRSYRGGWTYVLRYTGD